MKPTMKAIARQANVSEGTVSNVINNRKGVSEETARRILKIAEDMGYLEHRNEFTKSRNIRYVVYKKYGNDTSLAAYYTDMIEEIERICRSQNFDLMIRYIIAGRDNLEDSVRSIMSDDLAGLIIQATEMEAEELRCFRMLHLPTVVVDHYLPDELYDFVQIDFRRGAYLATKYLIQKGHTEIGILNRTVDIRSKRLRQEGFSAALQEYGLEEKAEYKYEMDSSLDGSYRDMCHMLQNDRRPMPTAFVAYNDAMAFGAMRALNENGFAVPDRVSIIGFDDMPFCEISHPRLTTMKSYNREIGKIAAQRLLTRIRHPDVPRVKIDVDMDLIERESVAEPASRKEK